MKTLLYGIYRLLQMASTITGLCMMLVENEDFALQMKSLGFGLLLFCIGVIPAIIESMITYEREEDEYIR